MWQLQDRKKYHKLNTHGQITKLYPTKQVQQIDPQSKSTKFAEVVQEIMMAQSVKYRIAQMNKKNQSTNEPQFKFNVKKEEVKKEVPGQAEIVTEQVFTSVSDKKMFQINKGSEKQQINLLNKLENNKIQTDLESKYIISQDYNQEQRKNIQNQLQENNQEDSEQNQLNYEQENDQQQQHQDDQQQGQNNNKNNKIEQQESNNQNEQVEQFQQQNDKEDEEQQDNQEQKEANNQDEASNIY